jgi:hypothetical protein
MLPKPLAKVMVEPAQAFVTAYRKVVVSVTLSPVPETAAGDTQGVVITWKVTGASAASVATTVNDPATWFAVSCGEAAKPPVPA